MAEDLTVLDVEQYTQGRLLASDPETQRILDASLDRVRRFCGWHVSPVKTQTFTLRGSWHNFIVLPTLKVVSIDSITDDGETIDPTTVDIYTDEPGVLYRKSWCGRIEVTVQHGYTAAEAAAFRAEVLGLIDRTDVNIGTGTTGPLTEIHVDDVSYRWSGVTDRLTGVAKNPLDESVLYQYRLIL